MDVLNFISWIKGRRQVTTVDPTQTILPVGLKDARRDDSYLAGAISVEDFAASIITPPAYKVYTALVTQSGTNAPVVTVLENTLNIPLTWVRNTTGQYSAGDITSYCPDNKTVYKVSDASNGINLYGVPLKQVHLWTFGNNVPQTARFLNLSVTTVDNSGNIAFADWDSPKVFEIEIRVYN
jgi:hypothetical protein